MGIAVVVLTSAVRTLQGQLPERMAYLKVCTRLPFPSQAVPFCPVYPEVRCSNHFDSRQRLKKSMDRHPFVSGKDLWVELPGGLLQSQTNFVFPMCQYQTSAPSRLRLIFQAREKLTLPTLLAQQSPRHEKARRRWLCSGLYTYRICVLNCLTDLIGVTTFVSRGVVCRDGKVIGSWRKTNTKARYHADRDAAGVGFGR